MTLSSFLNRHKGKPVAYRHSKKQEKREAKRLGGRLTPASGAKATKGDVKVKGVLRLEAKATVNKSFSVTREMVRKIEDAALSSGEMPAIVVEFLEPDGKIAHRIAVVPYYVLDAIVQGW